MECFCPICATENSLKIHQFAMVWLWMRQTGHNVDCVSLIVTDWATVCPPCPPLIHLSVIMDKKEFRPTNQSPFNVCFAVSPDLSLPVPPSSWQARPQPSTLPTQVHTHKHTGTHPNTSCWPESNNQSYLIFPINTTVIHEHSGTITRKGRHAVSVPHTLAPNQHEYPMGCLSACLSRGCLFN